MKRFIYLFCLSALIGASGMACSGPDEPVLPQSQQTEVVVAAETGSFVSEAAAARVAEAFFMSRGGEEFATRSRAGSLSTPSSIASIKAEAGDPAMHVLNYPGGGFAIVSATRDYYPVLAYSDEGSFELTPDMGPVEVWIDETKEAIRMVGELDAEARASISAAWSELEPAGAAVSAGQEIATRAGYDPRMQAAFEARLNELYYQYGPQGWYNLSSLDYMQGYLTADDYNNLCNLANSYDSPPEYTIVVSKSQFIEQKVGPLMTTKWHQYSPYYYDCKRQAVGCVPIAIAQIMKCFEKPTYYNWSDMDDIQATYSQTDLTQFLKIVGNRAGITYTGPSGDSGATPAEAKSAFESFNYTATLSNHNATTVKNWLFNERKPVYMRGRASNDGHAWVCDGVKTSEDRMPYFVEFIDPRSYTYSNHQIYTPAYPGVSIRQYQTYFNHNWGWNDSNDGWFMGNNVNTTLGNFSSERKNIYAKPR